jgi:hypothetical protein
MRQELEEKLMHEFPFMQARNLWTGKKLDFPKGCECGDGWFDLIFELCSQIQKVLDKQSPEFVESFYPTQIKEKYATLNFYTTYHNDEIFELIDEAETKSQSICEECGDKNATIRGQLPGWIYTRCDECWEAFRNRMNNYSKEKSDE